MRTMPLPRAFHNGFQIREHRLPAQLAPDFFRTGNQDCWIARAARRLDHPNRMSGDFPRYFDHLPHTEALPIAEVVEQRIGILGCILQRMQRRASRSASALAGAFTV